ncbi:hypothetical protein WK55_22035 [Burkholderia ubonensis]|nr:hypothetical protein WK55_22035 [Burkholderia ubonensis]
MLSSDSAPRQAQVGDDDPFQSIIDKLNQTMQSEDGTLEQYEKVVEAVMKIVQAISHFMADVGTHVRSTSDGKGIAMDATQLATELQNIMGSLGGGVCPDTDAWKDELAPLIPAILSEYSGQLYVNVNMDGSLLQQMLSSIQGMAGDKENNINPAAYQAWWAGFQGMESQLENMGQTIAEKYSHRNSNFDNLIKVISSTVQSMVDTSKQFLQI